jgi:hypothetical protein
VPVASGRTVVVFNIRGNRYCLVTAIHYNRQIVDTLKFLMHAEYSKDRWKNSASDKQLLVVSIEEHRSPTETHLTGLEKPAVADGGLGTWNMKCGVTVARWHLPVQYSRALRGYNEASRPISGIQRAIMVLV